MSERGDDLVARLSSLRAAFDAGFGLPVETGRAARRGYLAIRLNDAPYALALEQVASVRKGLSVTPLPSEQPLLLGVAGFGGTLTAVFDLAGLLGQARDREAGWFVLVQGAPVAFAVHALEGQLEVEESAADAGATGDADGASELVWRSGLSRPVIRVDVLLARIFRVVTESRTQGEGSR